MKDLKDIRVEIDAIDRQIIQLFEERMTLTSQVAEYKISTGKQVFDAEREASKLDTVESLASSEFTGKGVRELFEHIMSISRTKQYQLLTSHGKQAETGFTKLDDFSLEGASCAYVAVSDTIAQSILPVSVSIQKCRDWEEACFMMEKGIAQYLLFSIKESVAADYNMILENGFHIIHEYIKEGSPKVRYLLLSKEAIVVPGADKITLCFEASDEIGGLYRLISHLAYNNLNMNRIETVVLSTDSPNYRFFIDISGNFDDSAVQNAVLGLSGESKSFKIIGNYR